MTLTVKVVEPAFVQQAWPVVEQYIVAAIKKGADFPEEYQDYTIDNVRGFLASGQWVLIVAVDEEDKVQGAATLSFFNYPLHRVAFVTTMGGRFVTGTETAEQLKQLVKTYGATKIQAYGRPSMVRLLQQKDFQVRNTLVEMLV